MSEYAKIAKEVNKEENIDARIKGVESVLKAEVEAMLSSAKATLIRAQSNFQLTEQRVKEARGYITDNGRNWMENLNRAKNSQDEAAEKLRVAQLEYDNLEEELRLFA